MEILRRRSNLHVDGYTLEGCRCPLFPPFFFFFSSPFFSSSSSFRQSSRRNVRERERERHEVVLFRDAPYYNGPPRAGEHPVESHSRMCLRTRGLGFLSKLKTNSSHLCHRWHNNHLCLLLLLSPPSFLELLGFYLFIFTFLFYTNWGANKKRTGR